MTAALVDMLDPGDVAIVQALDAHMHRALLDAWHQLVQQPEALAWWARAQGRAS